MRKKRNIAYVSNTEAHPPLYLPRCKPHLLYLLIQQHEPQTQLTSCAYSQRAKTHPFPLAVELEIERAKRKWV